MRWGRVPSRVTVRVQDWPVPSVAGASGVVTSAVRVSTPVVRSHCSAQAWTSRSVAEARLSMKSARVALANLWRAKWALMPARKSFSPSQATSWRRAEAPLA
ncbi:hypothetical protein SCALM49S_07223 [Streptomyces californicus]